MSWRNDAARTGAGYGLALLAAVLWSAIGPLSKMCQAEGLSPLDIAFWRAALGGLCFAAQSACLRQLRLPPAHALLFALFGMAGVGAFFSVLQVAILKSGAAVSMVLMYTAPVWVALFARLLFHEAVSRYRLGCILVALAGTGLVCLSGGSLPASFSALGIVCGLASGFCYALHFPFFVWWKERYSTAVIYTYMLLGGALSLLPFAHILEGAPAGWEVWTLLLLLGVGTNYAAYYAYGQSLRLIPQVPAAVIGNVEPLLATFWVWQFWGEDFSLSGWAGSVCILTAVLCITLEPRTGVPQSEGGRE